MGNKCLIAVSDMENKAYLQLVEQLKNDNDYLSTLSLRSSSSKKFHYLLQNNNSELS